MRGRTSGCSGQSAARPGGELERDATKMPPPCELRLTAGALATRRRFDLPRRRFRRFGANLHFLDWSLAAQESKAPRLEIDDRTIAKRSPEEADWISAIAAADPGGSEALASFRDSLLEKVRSVTYAESRAAQRDA